MIKSIEIVKFRSIKEIMIELPPLTFLYGRNAAGKSSLFYTLNVFRNLVSNPNQTVDIFFNLNFVNLGGFKQVIFNHEDRGQISMVVNIKEKASPTFTYKIILQQNKGEFSLDVGKPYNLKLFLPVTFPYPLNSRDEKQLQLGEDTFTISWSGLTAQVVPSQSTPELNEKATQITALLNRPQEIVRSLDVVPLKRGFSKPQYGIITAGTFPANEDEVASKIASEAYLEEKISTYLEQIMDRRFRAKVAPGTSLVTLNTTETESKQTMELVNDGFGVNQLVYLLAKVLNKDTRLACIEEPEINLHPGVIRKLPKMFIDLVQEEDKQLIISTHSEALIIALLASVARGEIKPEEVGCYLTNKEKGVTTFQRQQITKDGQIEGGLSSFMFGELEDIDSFLKTKREQKSTDV